VRGISTSPGSSSTCRRPESLESRPGRARYPRARTSAASSDLRRCDRGSAASTAPRSFSLRGSRAALRPIRDMDPRWFVLGFSVAALAIGLGWASGGTTSPTQFARGPTRRPRTSRPFSEAALEQGTLDNPVSRVVAAVVTTPLGGFIVGPLLGGRAAEIWAEGRGTRTHSAWASLSASPGLPCSGCYSSPGPVRRIRGAGMTCPSHRRS
jgi:hypothetical protein